MPGSADASRALAALRAVSFTYYAYAGLFGAYAPLWFQSLGLGTLAIGAFASLQSATRVVSPYAWGWVADHRGRRVELLRLAAGLAWLVSLGFFVAAPSTGWLTLLTALLFICTAAVVPLSEAAATHLVSRGRHLDAARYGRVRLWGSLGFVVAVLGAGYALQWAGVGWFPAAASLLLAALLAASWRLPAQHETPHRDADTATGTWHVLRRPSVAWFFAGLFFTVLAHTSLYAFLSLYLVSLGYDQGEVGVVWVLGVLVEIGWFAGQGRWLYRLSLPGWLLLAALVAAARFAVLAAWGANAALLVLSQLTHGLTFAAQHTACIAFVNRQFPGRLRSRGQALYTVIGYGASGAVGGIGGGVLSQRFGFAAVFWAACGCALVGAACCWRALRGPDTAGSFAPD